VLLDVDMLMPDSFCTILFSWSFLQDKGSATPQYHRLSFLRFSLTFVAVNIATTWWYPTKYTYPMSLLTRCAMSRLRCSARALRELQG
jgi:hypothetical protein